MATDKISLELSIEAANAAKTVGEVRKSFRDLQQAISETEEGTEAYTRAVNALGNTKGKLKDLKEEINRLDPDNRVKAFVGVAQGIAGGFAAAQGAVALFAGENEDLQKVLVKTQAAVALAMGIDQLKEAAKSWKVLNTVIKQNPLLLIGGVIAAVVGALVVYTSETEKNTEAVIDAKKAEDEHIKSLQNKEKELNALGKAQLLSRKKQLEEELKALGFTSAKEEDINNVRIANIEDLTAAELEQLQLQGKQMDDANKDLVRDLNTELAIINEQLKKIRKIESDSYKERQDALKAHKKEWKDLLEQQRREQLEHDIETERLSKESEDKAAVDKINANLAAMEEAARIKKYRDDEAILTDQQTYAARLSMYDSFVVSISALGELMIQDQDKLNKFNKAVALFQIAIDTARAVSSLNAESAAAAAKMAAITGPATPIFTAAYYAGGIARILANVAKAKQLLSGGSPSAGGGGGAINIPRTAPDIQQPQSGLTLLNPDGTVRGNGSGQTVKAYVVESDLRNVKGRVDKIERNASF